MAEPLGKFSYHFPYNARASLSRAKEREVTAEYEPTADQRALVENAAAFGLTQADIATQLGIDE
jgi:hypothetical protein